MGMKLFVKCFLILAVLFCVNLNAFAKSFQLLVLPVDLLEVKENYYAFDEVSEIIAKDVISNFEKTNQINAYDIYSVREKLAMNSALKLTTANALKKYKTSSTIDFDVFKKVNEQFNCNSVLIISSYVPSSYNSVKRSLWDVLDLSSASGVYYPFELQTYAVLIDTVNELVMWSGNYSKKVSSNDDSFFAKNYAQAKAHYENIRLYSKEIAAKEISQNVILRFFPKTIRPVDKKIDSSDSSGALRFERTIPVITRPEKTVPQENTENYGDMIFGI